MNKEFTSIYLIIIKMQLFIKLPTPYNKHIQIIIENDKTLKDLKNLINRKTISEYDSKYSNLEYYLSLERGTVRTKPLIANNYIYDSLKYYYAYGTGIINEEHDNLTINEYNKLYPLKKISNDCTLTFNIRA